MGEIRRAYDEAVGLLPSEQSLYGQFGQLGALGKQQLQDYYGQIQQDIGAQFNPAFRLAQSRLAGSPLLADSGYANRLNRQLQQGAFSDLTSRYGAGANELAGGNLAALRQMLQQRQAAQHGLLGDYFSQKSRYAQRPKRSLLGGLGSLVGTAGGALIGGPPGAAAGGSIGGSIGGGLSGGYQANDAYYA